MNEVSKTLGPPLKPYQVSGWKQLTNFPAEAFSEVHLAESLDEAIKRAFNIHKTFLNKVLITAKEIE